MPLGKEIYQAFCDAGVNTSYADLREFQAKSLYGFRSAYRKMLNKRENADSFYHFPKLREAGFEAFIRQECLTTILVIGYVYKYLSPKFLEKLKHLYSVKLFLYDTDSCNFYSKRREFIFFLDNELPIYDEIFSFSKVTTKFFNQTKKLKETFFLLEQQN